MTAPVPWKKSGSSAPAVARLLDGVEGPRSLDPVTRARIAKGIAAATGVAVVAAAASTAAAAPATAAASAAAAPTAAAAAPAIATGSGIKLLAGAIAAIAITAGVLAWPAAPSPTSVSAPPPQPVEVAPAASAAVPAPSLPATPPSADIPVRSVADLPSVQLPSAAPARTETTPRSDTLERELALLDGARKRMASDPSGALALLDDHAKTFGGGQLGLERDVMRVDALLRLGRRTEAEATTEGLRARAPGSLQAQRARAMIERAQ